MRAGQPLLAAHPLCSCAAGLAGALLFVFAVGAAARTHTVRIENMLFAPAHLTVHRGDRIMWINQDFFPHTVSEAAGQFDSGHIAASASWSYRAAAAGEYAYVCRLHPGMQGRVTVLP